MGWVGFCVGKRKYLRTRPRIHGSRSGLASRGLGSGRGVRAAASTAGGLLALGFDALLGDLGRARPGSALDAVGDRDPQDQRGDAAGLLGLRGSAATVGVGIGAVAEADLEVAADRGAPIPEMGLNPAAGLLLLVLVVGVLVVLHLLGRPRWSPGRGCASPRRWGSCWIPWRRRARPWLRTPPPPDARAGARRRWARVAAGGSAWAGASCRPAGRPGPGSRGRFGTGWRRCWTEHRPSDPHRSCPPIP